MVCELDTYNRRSFDFGSCAAFVQDDASLGGLKSVELHTDGWLCKQNVGFLDSASLRSEMTLSGGTIDPGPPRRIKLLRVWTQRFW